MNANLLLEFKALGQHVWLGNLSRTILEDGTLQRLTGEQRRYCRSDGPIRPS